MRDILKASQRPLLADLARKNTLLAFDFDGTLAPIVGDRARAGMRPETASLLARVTSAWPTAVLSGRSESDLRERFRGKGITRLVGNHGMEGNGQTPLARGWRARSRRWAASLERRVGSIDGVEIEDKGVSLSIHYRRAPSGGAARRTVEDAVRALAGARIVGGKKVVNVLPEGAPDKGKALATLLRRGRFEAGLFLGDDLTDESVFGRSFSVPVVAIRVGRNRKSRAVFYLPRQRSVDDLLRRLASLRPGGGGRPPRRETSPRLGPRREARERGAGKRGRRLARRRGNRR